MFNFLRKAQAQPSMASPAIAQPIVATQAKFRAHRIHVPVLHRNVEDQLLIIEYLGRPVAVSYDDVVYDFSTDAWVVSYAITSQIK